MSIPRWTLRGLVAVAFAIATPAALAAQGVTTGAISGTVTSDQHMGVEGAQIQVVNRTTGFTSRVTTRTDGRYTVPGLEVGSRYSVTVRRIGFQPQTRDNIVVVLSQVTRVDFELVTQATQLQAVNVVANQDPVMSSSHTGVTTTISDSALRRLPTLNGNFTDFVVLTPQVSTAGPGLSGGGTNNRYNNIQIDGSTEADLFGLGSTGQPGGQANGKSIGLGAVKEYQVLLSPFDVRQGNFSGLLVNAVTKSGTNEWHGSMYGTTRNQGYTRSQPYITNYKQSQGGFNIGGPLIKDRALFFVDAEWQARTSPANGPYVGGSLPGPSQANVDQVNQALAAYGMPTGSGALVNNGNPLANVFARFDFNLPGNTQLVIRDNYGRAVQDIFSRSASTFQLDNNGYHFSSKKNAAVAQLRTLFDNGSFNELLVNYETIRDRRNPGRDRASGHRLQRRLRHRRRSRAVLAGEPARSGPHRTDRQLHHPRGCLAPCHLRRHRPVVQGSQSVHPGVLRCLDLRHARLPQPGHRSPVRRRRSAVGRRGRAFPRRQLRRLR